MLGLVRLIYTLQNGILIHYLVNHLANGFQVKHNHTKYLTPSTTRYLENSKG